MNAIILAGGYATKLWPLTKYVPKPLLPVAGKPIIDFIMEQLTQVKDIGKVIVSTNIAYENNFRYWLRGLPQEIKTLIELVIEPTSREEDKLGAIAGIVFAIQQKELTNGDLLIIAGDNLFEFRLGDFVDFYKRCRKPTVAFCDSRSVNIARRRYGVGILDEDNKIIDFQEKPEDPKSSLIATGCYLYPSSALNFFQRYLRGRNNRDAPGHFVAWLCHHTDVYGFVFDKAWYDIGSFESYEQAIKNYGNGSQIEGRQLAGG